uniref:Uncharacterized protein n=1 Tax=Arundo donax TaxID=35708 RepID=A0A0A9H7U7_ARUDO
MNATAKQAYTVFVLKLCYNLDLVFELH